MIDPALKAKMVMALLGVAILGLGLMLLVVLGGRMVRRMSRAHRRPSQTMSDPWYIQRPRRQSDAFESSDDGQENEPGDNVQ